MTSRTRTAAALAGMLGLAAPLGAAAFASKAPAADAALWRMLAVEAFFAGLALLLALRLGGALRERLGLVRARLNWRALALGALGTLALSGTLRFAVHALALLPGTSLERLDDAAAGAASSSPLLVFAAFALAPPFGEELLCRGVLQRSLARAIGAWSIFAAALAFAVLHLDVVHSAAAFLLGAYLGTLAWLSGTTWLAIACHFVNNTVALLGQLVPGAGGAIRPPASWTEAVGSLILALALLGATAWSCGAWKSPMSGEPSA